MRRAIGFFLLFGLAAIATSACTTESELGTSRRAAIGKSKAKTVRGAGGQSTGDGDAFDPAADAPLPPPVALGASTRGIATFYDADGSGNCGYPASPQDLLVVAPNKAKYYAGSAICGECMRVTGVKGSVVVRVVDSCPLGEIDGDCGESGADIDLSAQAFAMIDEPDNGRVEVTFEPVACEVQGPMRYRFKAGSSQWWTAIQIQNHRVPIAKVEYESGGSFVALKRSDDNYFVAQKGVGQRPNGLALRITSSTGQVVSETLAGVRDDATLTGTQQF